MKKAYALIGLLLLVALLMAQNTVLRDFSCQDAGANDTYACSLPAAPSGYVTGQRYLFKANTANTGAATVNFNSLGAITIKKASGGVTTDLNDNDIRAGQWVGLIYDGTNMQMQSVLGNVFLTTAVTSIATTAPLAGGTITSTGTLSITGAAGQLLAGAGPAFTATPSLGTDNSVAGTLTLANGSANAHTIWSSGATTTNTIQGFAAVPTTGRLLDCTVTTTTCLLHDSGITTANVVTYSSPATGIARTASGSQALVGTELSGDATTSGSNAVSLAAPFKKRSCEIVWGGTGASNVLQSGDDGVANNSCFNKTGVTLTITAVYCMADIASNTVTVNPTFGSAGTGTTILSGALTCGSSSAYSSTGTVSNGALTDGTGINPVQAGTLNAHSIHLLIVYTVPNS